MFHIINAIWANTSQTQSNKDDAFIILTLDIKNAYNTHSRQRIYDFFAKRCPTSGSSNSTNPGWNILWQHFVAHYGTTGFLKFYHSGRTYTIDSETGTQQGDPLGGLLFTAPLQPLFTTIADKFPELLICAFADNTVFMGPSSQTLPAADLFHNLLAEANLTLNSLDSNILIGQSTNETSISNSITTPAGLVFPSTVEGIKLLGSPLGKSQFCQDLFQATIAKIEKDHARLQDFPNLHQRVKLLTFNVNTRINYFLRNTSPFISEPLTVQLDSSVDNLLADTLNFPATF